MTAVVSRKWSQSNPDLSVSHIGLQRSLESLNGEAGMGNSKAFDSNRSFGEQMSLTNKRSKLVYMDKIAALELQLSSLVNAVSDRAAELNSSSSRGSLGGGQSQPGSTDSMPKVDEVATCWSWIVQLSRLSQIHITYAAEYHKFFYEAREIGAQLEQEKARVFADLTSNDRRSLGSLPFECRRLSGCMRSHLSRLMLLGQRAQELSGRSGSVQPVHHRTPGRTADSTSRRAVALCSYTSPEGQRVVLDEELQVVDMSDRHVWRVEKSASNGGGQLDLPSVCLALLGPDQEALETMARLRDTIIAVWVQILTSYKQHVGDLLRSFLEFVNMEKYTTDSDAAEASLYTFLSEVESSYMCYLSGNEAAAMARLLNQIRARRAPPSDQAVRASRERRLSNVSLSSVTSTEGFSSGGGGLSRNDSLRNSGRRTRSLKESEVIQPRALLKVLNEHVEALERLRNRRLDSNREASTKQDEAALNSPGFSVPEIRIETDSSVEQSTNVYVFSNQTDAEKLTKQQPPISQSQGRTRNLSTASARTVTSTVVNEEVHQLLQAGVATGSGDVTDGRRSVVRSSSAIGEPSPSTEPKQHVSRMYWMVNQPTRVEREIHRAELMVHRRLAVDLPHRNFVSAKRIEIGGDACDGVRAVTRVECNYPPRRPVVDSGASLDIDMESRGAQTLGDFKEVRPTSALSTQTLAPVSSECGAFLDFVSEDTGVRAAEEQTPKSDQQAQTIGEFKEVRPTVALATQTQPSLASECCAFVDLDYVSTGVRKVEQPPPTFETSAQTVGEFKEVRPTVALATQTLPPALGECGAFKDFVSLETGVLAAEKPPPTFETSAQTVGEFKEVRPTVALATQTQPPQLSDCGALRDFSSLQTGVRAAEKSIPKFETSAQTFGEFKEARPTVALTTQTLPPTLGECGAFKDISTLESGVRAAEKPIPKSETPAQTTGEFKEVRPAVALATQTQKPTASECGAFLDFASVDSGIRAAEKPPSRSHSSAQTPVPEPGRGANVRVAPAPPPIAECGSQLVAESLTSLAKCRPSADAFANASSQANFQLELVARLTVRNHNLEDARLLSVDRSVSERPENDGLVSDEQVRLLSSLGLVCSEWSELDSKHRAPGSE
ncbi:hypothetical protein BOX15_Mlig023320g1 [Macrostomum lignano]|uniref:Desmoplakin SH3 domain-containing protein n=1 Tax=Macrostomum lignano TaxID=282301 RepID=A0A267DUX3_9PLAT|nr:hypothetical protein BOX15_Mlig023320g1 [Macrostomum lignano]